MKKQVILLAIGLLGLCQIQAQDIQTQDIQIDTLGSLQLEFESVKKTNVIPGKKIIATVGVKSGEPYVLTTPTNIQQLSFSVGNGELVNKGQPFAILRGPEVHHFLSELNAVKTLLDLSEQRMKNSKKLFTNKLIEESKWLAINQNYYTNMLEYEHMMHFYELIDSIDENTDSIILKAPITGIIINKQTSSPVVEGDVIANFIAENDIRMKLRVASNRVSHLKSVQLDSCQLTIDHISRIAQGVFVNVWTESIKPECKLLLGQTQLVSPLYQQDAYQIAKQAVVSLEGRDYIFLRSNGVLMSQPVTLVTKVGEKYIFTAEKNLSGEVVLVSSVSAVQGILIGLGGE